jgi:hypothetical protein
MIDLNNPDTYQIQDFGGGNTLYRDTSTGQFYDPGDLSTPLSTSDVQQYGAPASSSGAISIASGSGSPPAQSPYTSAAPGSTANSGGSGGINLSGLTGLFTAVGSAFASKINPPTTTKQGQPLVYDAIRGTYIPASAAGQSVTNLSSIPMWLVIGLVALALILVFAARKRG